MKKIADTGLLVAAADARDRDHAWAATALRSHAPFHTCEAVVLETAWVLGSPRGMLSLLAQGDLVLDPAFDFATELPRLQELCAKYADREMDLADGGLEHGDEWDTKIRRQIKECVLFIPVISANTQARLEGYFRLEWELAAQRAMSIASGVPFILPVVIDDTREPDALVPDRFRMIQWTRLPGGVVTPEVKARYLQLWSHRTGALKHETMEAGRPRPAERDGGVAPSAESEVGRAVVGRAQAHPASAHLDRRRLARGARKFPNGGGVGRACHQT